MKNRLVTLFGLLTLACTVALGADVTGKWTAESGRGGTQTYELKQDGSTLTGTIAGGRGEPAQISNGKVDGDNVSFEVTREFNGNSVTTKYSGTVSGNTIKLSMETARGTREITLTKQE